MLAVGMPPWDPQLLLGGAKANVHLPEPSCSPRVTISSPKHSLESNHTLLHPQCFGWPLCILERDLSGVSTGAAWGHVPVTPPHQHS